MAKEKFQKPGQHDNPNHHGYHANRQKLEEALNQDDIAEQILISMAVVRQLERVPEEIGNYHVGILKAWGIIY